MVSVCSSSRDPDFLRSLYEYLIDTEHADVLLRINSPALECWLRDERKDVNLLWRYYARNGRDALAGETMRRRGCAADKVQLDERVECLEKALNSFASASERGGEQDISEAPFFSLADGNLSRTAPRQRQRAPTREELGRAFTQVKEQLEVARLQQRILHASESVPKSSLDDAKRDALSFSLVSATDLYNDFAAPLALYDLCLLMLCTCGNNDPATISTLWRSILSEEVLPCKTRSPEAYAFINEMARTSMVEENCQLLTDEWTGNTSPMLFEDGTWIPRLRDRVTSLGKELYGKGADYTFPIELLIECLEGLRRAHDAAIVSSSSTDSSTPSESNPWPLMIFLDVGVHFSSLLGAYDAVFFSRGGHGITGQGEDHGDLLQRLASIGEVLKLWASTAFSSSKQSFGGGRGEDMGNGTSNMNATNDAFVQLSQAVSSGGLLSRIDVYKASLESSMGNNDERSSLYSMFRDVEDSIKRST
uniref:Nucleoporin Nup133/Nup155-like C-terminal domain-containing protein n=1 Tax=Pseudictyota dubia TaxID=2749911 RepID=A0A7R9Z0R8_9STRA